MMKTFTSKQLQVIVEIVYNVVKGICPISDADKTVLYKKKRLIRGILVPRLSQKRRIHQLRKIKKVLQIFLRAYLNYGT